VKQKRRGLGLGGKTIAQKVEAALRKMPAVRAEIQRDIAAHLAASRQPRLESGMPEPIDRRDFAPQMLACRALQVVIAQLAGAPGMGNVVQTIDEAEEEYGPGGPPVSPVHDSLFTTWSTLDLSFGRHRETVASIALRLAKHLGLDDDVRATIETHAATRLGVYRVLVEEPPRAGVSARIRLRELVTERELWMQFFEAYDVRAGDLLLVRPVPLPDASARARGVSHVAFVSPYVLKGHTDPEWLDYFEREAGEQKTRLDAEVYAKIMRGHGNPRRWLEYVFVGYVGQREKNVVLVEGIPDRPETLQHHEDYDRSLAYIVPPGASVRERATVLARKVGDAMTPLMEERPESWHDALRERYQRLNEADADLEAWHALVMAVALFEVGVAGEPPIVVRALEGDDLEADDREYLEAAQRGFTSIFEVIDVTAGQGMRLRDLLAGTEHEVQERSGSLGVPTRVVVFARLVEYRGTWLIDACHPQPLPPQDRDTAVTTLRGLLEARRADPTRLGEAVFDAMVAFQCVIVDRLSQAASARSPQLVTTTGEPIAWSSAVFDFAPGDRARVRDTMLRLRRCYVEDGSDDEPGTERFVLLTKDDFVEGRVLVGRSTLTIETNARERTHRIKKRISVKIPNVLTLRTEDIEPIEEAMRASAPKVREASSPEQLDLIAMVLRQHYEGFLDVPVPALDDLSPRQAARDPTMRDRLDRLLREHEHGVTRQVGPGVVDFAAIRREIGLPE
jgi:hypothetical protein